MNRVRALRLSLLVSIGAIPAACGGTVTHSHDDDPNAGSGNTTTGQGGSGSKTPGPGKMLPPGPATGGTGVVGTGGSIYLGGSFGTGGGTGGTGHATTNCTTPKYDPRTGLVSCAEGYRYRPTAVACGKLTGQGGEPSGLGGAGPSEEPSLPRVKGNVGCWEDIIGGAGPTARPRCGDFANGYCKTYDGAAGAVSVCESGCATDAECGPGYICLCDEPDSPTGGACRPADCATDANCAAGYRCASFDDGCSSGFACQTPGDECLGDNQGCGLCGWDELTAKRRCSAGCAIGRPFLVESHARLAPVVARRDWLASTATAPRVDHLTSAERAALAQHWTQSGQMEHASIAAFARFSLQLLALGAPPDLIDACTQALADETAHAKLCFSIASAYAGHAVGPGILDVSRSLEVTSLVDIVDLVIAEGCFGETSAALEALEAADTATDPLIAAAYSQIAADEQRHAELAFRFVRWALERDGESVAERISAALAAPAVSRSAREVAQPCLQALLARRLAA